MALSPGGSLLDEVATTCTVFEPSFAPYLKPVAVVLKPSELISGRADDVVAALPFAGLLLVELPSSGRTCSLERVIELLNGRMLFIGAQCDEQAHFAVWLRLWPVDMAGVDKELDVVQTLDEQEVKRRLVDQNSDDDDDDFFDDDYDDDDDEYYGEDDDEDDDFLDDDQDDDDDDDEDAAGV